MPLVRLLRRAFAARPAARPRPPARRLGLEGLEDRTTPSGGLLDPTFGSGGFVLKTSSSDFFFADVLVQDDGKIVAGGLGNNLAGGRTTTGSDFAVARYNPDGTLDTAFGSGGLAAIDFSR